MVVGNKLLSSF